MTKSFSLAASAFHSTEIIFTNLHGLWDTWVERGLFPSEWSMLLFQKLAEVDEQAHELTQVALIIMARKLLRCLDTTLVDQRACL